jgi:nucleoside 2-deoxyribosyltransferase
MKIYCVGGITGLNGDEVFGYYDRIKKDLGEMGFDVYHPMVGKDHMRTEEEFLSEGNKCSPITADNAIFNRDKWMVQHSDIVFADFTRSTKRASIGTCFEIAWANLAGKMVIAVVPDGNIHNHVFIKQACSAVFKSTEEALVYLEMLMKGR